MAEIQDAGPNNEAAAKFMQLYLQSGNLNFLIGSGASFPAIKLAGNVEAEINALLKEGKDEQANLKCVAFIEEIDAVHAQMIIGTDATVKKVLDDYVRLIAAIDHILFARKNILLPRQANIFTSNYDMFVEQAANMLPAVILNDGFDRTSGLTTDFGFAPERYFDRTYRSNAGFGHQVEIPTVNLIKIHGSLSWRRRAEMVVFDPKPIAPLTEAEKGDATKIAEYIAKHFLILPNLRKFHATLMERVYYDLLRLFSKAMDQQNVALICFGFSFADEHIMDITKRALRNPTSHLIIFAHNAAAVGGYQEKFSKHRNVTIVAPDNDSVIDLPRFSKILSMIPAKDSDAAA